MKFNRLRARYQHFFIQRSKIFLKYTTSNFEVLEMKNWKNNFVHFLLALFSNTCKIHLISVCWFRIVYASLQDIRKTPTKRREFSHKITILLLYSNNAHPTIPNWVRYPKEIIIFMILSLFPALIWPQQLDFCHPD